MLRCPRTYSGRPSVLLGRPVRVLTTVGVRSYDGRYAQFWRSVRTVGVSTDSHGRAVLAACPGLTRAAESSVHPCVRPPDGSDTSPGRCGQGRAVALMTGAVRETVTLAGRAERARLARAFVEGVLGPGHPCEDVAALQGGLREQCAAQRLGCCRGDGHGRGQGRGRRRPGRGHRSRRAGDAGAASCEP
jgi:hypothetical protein